MRNEAFERAMEKLRDEMAAAKDQTTQAVGEMMCAHLRQNPGWADAILRSDKRLGGLYAAMHDAAKKKQKGGCYYMPPDEEARMAREYYGIADDAQTPAEKRPAAALDLGALLKGL